MFSLTFQLSYLLTFLRSILSALFITASLPKLRHPSTFASAVANYHLLSKALVNPFSDILPWLELVLGLLLLLGWQTKLAAVTSVALLLLFLVAMSINLVRGRKDLDCGCSGKKRTQKIGWKTITRNVILILLALPVAFWGGGFLALDNQSPTVQAFVLETLMLNSLFPLVLTGVGLVFLSRLLKQIVRLVLLSPIEIQNSDTENFPTRKPTQMEGPS